MLFHGEHDRNLACVLTTSVALHMPPAGLQRFRLVRSMGARELHANLRGLTKVCPYMSAHLHIAHNRCRSQHLVRLRPSRKTCTTLGSGGGDESRISSANAASLILARIELVHTNKARGSLVCKASAVRCCCTNHIIDACSRKAS